MIDYDIISTGSQGNGTILNGSVLIDCGIPFKYLETKYRGLKLVLLTHIHGDHFNPHTLKRLSFERPTLRFACCDWLSFKVLEAGVSPGQVDILKPGVIYNYGICRVTAFELTHDVPNCGWKIWFGNEKAFYATDTGNLNGIKAPNYDLYLVEANYNEDEMQETIAGKKLDGKFIYEYRVQKDHLSQTQTNDWLYQNMGPNSTYIYMHCHRDRKDA